MKQLYSAPACAGGLAARSGDGLRGGAADDCLPQLDAIRESRDEGDVASAAAGLGGTS